VVTAFFCVGVVAVLAVTIYLVYRCSAGLRRRAARAGEMRPRTPTAAALRALPTTPPPDLERGGSGAAAAAAAAARDEDVVRAAARWARGVFAGDAAAPATASSPKYGAVVIAVKEAVVVLQPDG
jgi:hypothetical protein